MKKQRNGIFIAVRMKSTRLPKKALLEIKGRTVIEHLIDRMKTSKLADEIVVCTSTNTADKILADIAVKNSVRGFQGSEDDKLERFLGAAAKYDIQLMAAVDGDDILCDAGYIDKTFQVLEDTGADMVKSDDLPLGMACNGLKIAALKKVCEMKGESDTEVWGGYFTGNSIFKVVNLDIEKEVARPDIRLTLDYIEDFRVFEAVFNKLFKPGKVFSLKQIVGVFNKYPELLKINKKVHEEYLKGIEKKAKLIKMKGTEGK